jgi:hypothetical protein
MTGTKLPTRKVWLVFSGQDPTGLADAGALERVG